MKSHIYLKNKSLPVGTLFTLVLRSLFTEWGSCEWSCTLSTSMKNVTFWLPATGHIGDLHKENEGACIDWILTHIWHLLFNHHLVVHLLLLIVLRLHIGLWLILKKVLFRRDARFSSQNSMGYYTLSLYPHFVTHVNPFYYIFGCVCVSVSSVCYRLLQNWLGGRPRKVAMQCKQFTQYLSLR